MTTITAEFIKDAKAAQNWQPLGNGGYNHVTGRHGADGLYGQFGHYTSVIKQGWSSDVLGEMEYGWTFEVTSLENKTLKVAGFGATKAQARNAACAAMAADYFGQAA